ncbi:hypothetical protein C8R43DRAFT_1230897 [Mycena crocata]|nr:hypothetical protein C8R43DRAFT_1230897 [Mycena crocata]
MIPTAFPGGSLQKPTSSRIWSPRYSGKPWSLASPLFLSHHHHLYHLAPPTSSFLQALPSGDVPFPAGWIRAQHVAELPRSGASDTLTPVKVQIFQRQGPTSRSNFRPTNIFPEKSRRRPSPCISAQFLVSPATPPAATLIISIDAPRAGCSSEILPPEANAALEIQKSVFTSSFSYAAQPRAAAQRRRKRLHDVQIPASGLRLDLHFDAMLTKLWQITRTCEPPCSGGRTDYTMYRNPASGLKFNFLPPEANAPLWLQSTIFPKTPVSPTHP